MAGTGHLDGHNGRLCVTPEYPGGTYAYFTTMDARGAPRYRFMGSSNGDGELRFVVPASFAGTTYYSQAFEFSGSNFTLSNPIRVFIP